MAREASERFERQGGRALWGRSLPYEEQTPYRAAGEMVRHVAGIYENDPVEVARAKVAAAVDELFPDAGAADATRYLSLLLGLGLDAPPDEAIHLLFTMRMLIEHLAERQPLLLVFEDVHWADDPLLDLIDYLVVHLRDARLLVMALARPEFLEAGRTWGGGMIGQTTLPLEPLGALDSKAVATALLPAADASTIERVVSVAEGNPLFLEELGPPWRTRSRATSCPRPSGPRSPGASTPSPPDARAALLNASVIGHDFWRGVLDGMGEMETDDALEALEARGLILRHPQSQVEGDVEFAFKHVLIRDVAYGTLPRGSRRELHGAVARYLEGALADPADLGWLLAHHWREAGEVDAARAYLLGAAERARDTLAVEETYDLFTRALELATTDEDRRRIRLRRALVLVELQDNERGDRELAGLLPELDGVDEIEALLARGRATLWTEQTDETISLSERALDLVRTRGPAELEALALTRVAQAVAMRGNDGDLDRAIELGDLATERWPGEERLLELAEHYHMHANALYWSGSYERALEYTQLAAETGGLERRGAEFLLRGAGARALILSSLGRYEEAIAAGDRAIETARRDGPRRERRDQLLDPPVAGDLRGGRRRGCGARRSPTDWARRSFNMPWINARADLIGAQVLMDDLAAVERSWSSAVGRRDRERRLGALAGLRPAGGVSGRAGSRVRPARRRVHGAPARSSSRNRGVDGSTWRTRARPWAVCSPRRGRGAARRPSSARPSRSPTSSDRRSCAGRAAPRSRERSAASRRERPPRRTSTHGRPRRSSRRRGRALARARRDLPRRSARRGGPRPGSLSRQADPVAGTRRRDRGEPAMRRSIPPPPVASSPGPHRWAGRRSRSHRVPRTRTPRRTVRPILRSGGPWNRHRGSSARTTPAFRPRPGTRATRPSEACPPAGFVRPLLRVASVVELAVLDLEVTDEDDRF